MFGRNKVAMVVAEFLGTFSLAGVVLSMLGRTSFPFFQAVAAGLAYGLMALIIGQSSGSHINPAVTIGMWVRRKIDITRTLTYVVAQIFGGLVAWKVFEYLLNSPLQSIGGDKFMWRAIVAEAIGAMIFAFGLSSAISQGYKGLRYAATVGGSLTLGVLLATFGGNGLLNPSVALAVQSWNIMYVLGPIVGVIVGMSLYDGLFAPSLSLDKVVAKVTTGRSTFQITKKAKQNNSKKKR